MGNSGMLGGMGANPAPAQNPLSDFGPGPSGGMDAKREPEPRPSGGSSFEASFSETSKLRAQLRAAEEMVNKGC